VLDPSTAYAQVRPRHERGEREQEKDRDDHEDEQDGVRLDHELSRTALR